MCRPPGTKKLDLRQQLEIGKHIGQGMRMQIWKGDSDEFQGIYPGTHAVQGGGTLHELSLRSHIVRYQWRSGPPRTYLRPNIYKSRGSSERRADLRMPTRRMRIEWPLSHVQVPVKGLIMHYYP